MREDWESSTLGAICEIVSGNTPKGIENINNIGDYHFYKVGDMNSFGNEITMTTSNYNLSEEDVKNLKIKIYPKGTVIFPKRGGAILTNKKRKLSQDATFDLNIMGVLPNKIVIGDFLYYWFLKLDLSKIYDGSNVPQINNKNIVPLNFLLPPIPEQRAVVKKLESLFSSLDAGVADLKKAQQQLKIYRQAVLKKAFEGELNKKLLGKISIIKRGKSKHRPRNDERLFGGSYPFIQTGEIRRANGGIVKEFENTYSEFGLAQSKLWPKGTLCLTIAANIGETAFLGFDACFPDSVVGITSDEDTVNLNYLNYYIQLTKQGIDKVASATAQKNINVDFLENLEIPLPSPEGQRQIVKQIESRLSVCDSIEQNITESLVKAEALRQSILKKAFEGNLLTAQELAECKQAADYEPASVLLERIKAEQNKISAKPSKKKVAQPLVAAKTETPVAKISADFHAGLIAKVIKIHEENPASTDNLSHIKCEKIAHLVEYHLQIPLGRQPVKDAAGPDDYPHLKSVESRAKKAGFFNIVKKPIGYSYSSAKNSDKAIDKFQSALSDEKNKQLDDLIALFLKFDLEVSEIIATTYAGWNNLILNGNTNPSDEEIVYESRENWSERKLKIARERFFKAIEWMRKNEIVPTGYGAVVPFPKKKK